MARARRSASVHEQLQFQMTVPEPVRSVVPIQKISTQAARPDHGVIKTQVSEPFGCWLLGQRSRRDWIADLAKAAAADPGFPKAGTPDEIRKRLNGLGAEGDVFEQVDDAEREWLACGAAA